jgi:hypothetical protein
MLRTPPDPAHHGRRPPFLSSSRRSYAPSRVSGDDLGLARAPWPNVADGDVFEPDDGGGLVRVIDVVHADGADVNALVKAAPLP